MTLEFKQLLFSLVRLGIGHGSVLSEVADWQSLRAFSDEQGLTAVMLDGVEKLPDDLRPPKVAFLQWVGEVRNNYEYRYESYCRAIAELAAFYNRHGYRMMILKGYACALNWPRPEHRTCGDIDIWQFGQQKEADAALVTIAH